MKPIQKNGWRIYFHPLFYQQWQELVNQVKHLKEKLQPEKFITHRDVIRNTKIFATNSLLHRSID